MSRTFSNRWTIIIMVMIIIAALKAAHGWCQSHYLMINQSRSLPHIAYIVDVGTLPARGDYVAFAPGPNPYFPEDLPFVKQVRGIGGDPVEIIGPEIRVAGVSMGLSKVATGENSVLTTVQAGTVPEGHFFVWTPSPDSFDSRYKEIGYVGKDRLIGRARPLF